MTQEEKIQNTKIEIKKEAKKEVSTGNKLAIVLVRGIVGLPQPVKDTLLLLKLNRKNHCVVVENNPVNLGMVKKVKDYVTWGEINDETFNELVDKRGVEFNTRLNDTKKKYTYKTLEINGKKYRPFFALNPPRKGFGRKGIKLSFTVGGALGDRKEKINDLIKRML